MFLCGVYERAPSLRATHDLRAMTSFPALPHLPSRGDTAERARRPRVVRNAVSSSPAPTAVSHVDPRCDVSAFLNGLAELPATRWLSFARDLADDAQANERRQRARTALESMLIDRGLLLSAWSVCDAIDTARFFAMRRPDTRWNREQLRLFGLAHDAVECAALALLSRDHLDPDTFNALAGAVTRVGSSPFDA